MESQTPVVFQRTGQGVGSKSWGYMAWYGSTIQKSSYAERVDGIYKVIVNREIVDLGTQDPLQIDNRIRKVIWNAAQEMARVLKTTIENKVKD